MRTERLLARYLRKVWILLLVRLSGFSIRGVRCVRALLVPWYLVRNVRRWRDVLGYIGYVRGAQQGVAALYRYYASHAEQVIWMTLAYEAWESALKHHDLRGVEDLRAMAARGRGLLVLGMHYGPRCAGYLLYRTGLGPAILVDRHNIPDLDGVSWKRLLPGDYVFRGTYDGIVQAGRSEKQFVRMLLARRPGLILNDLFADGNSRAVRCLGIDYPIGAFPFKLALRHALPVAVMWFSRIEGAGYRVNVRELRFATVDEGVGQYAAVLDQVVTTDPFLWNIGEYYAGRRRRAASA